MEEPSRGLSTEGPSEQPARLERGSFHDGSMHGGNQPTDISLIHRGSSRLVSHHPMPPCRQHEARVTTPTPIPPPGAGQSTPPDGLGGAGIAMLRLTATV